MDGADTTVDDDGLQCLKFSSSIPDLTGRGFIEVLPYVHYQIYLSFAQLLVVI
jgi:hypothetical protein